MVHSVEDACVDVDDVAHGLGDIDAGHHLGTLDGLIGVGTFQLSTADGTGFLTSLNNASLLSNPVAERSPPGTGNVQDVLGYLHGNCGYCHSDYGRWSTVRALRLRLRTGDADPAATPTYTTTINVPMVHVDSTGKPYIGVIPGDPDNSHLYMRMSRRDDWAMPPLGTEVPDDAALAAVRAWIAGLTP